MSTRRSTEWLAPEKRKPGDGHLTASTRTTTRSQQHSGRSTSFQESRAAARRATAAELKALYVALYCHGLLPAHSLVSLFDRHPEWVDA